MAGVGVELDGAVLDPGRVGGEADLGYVVVADDEVADHGGDDEGDGPEAAADGGDVAIFQGTDTQGDLTGRGLAGAGAGAGGDQALAVGVGERVGAVAGDDRDAPDGGIAAAADGVEVAVLGDEEDVAGIKEGAEAIRAGGEDGAAGAEEEAGAPAPGSPRTSPSGTSIAAEEEATSAGLSKAQPVAAVVRASSRCWVRTTPTDVAAMPAAKTSVATSWVMRRRRDREARVKEGRATVFMGAPRGLRNHVGPTGAYRPTHRTGGERGRYPGDRAFRDGGPASP